MISIKKSPKLCTEFVTDVRKYPEIKCVILIDDDILVYILYADNLILCSESEEGLQKLIDALFEFCKRNTVKKTLVMSVCTFSCYWVGF